MNDKNFVRKGIQEQLSTITKPMYEHFSYLIAKKLYEDHTWKHAKIIGITISKMPEVDTFQLIRKAWEEEKTVVIPKCLPKTREMEFRVLTAFSQLESIYSGLLEPIVSETEKVEKEEIEIMIVPGLGFTRNGYRLGFGGGYYDRYLKGYAGETVALAFDEQIVCTLPIESHDIPVRKIVTAREIIVTNE